MKYINTNIEGLTIIEPKIFGDHRGYFLETYNQKKNEEIFGGVLFIQDNESKSTKGVLRGLHFQKPPFEQAKLVRCIEGEVLDVAVDIRKKSPTYGEHFSIILSGKNKRQLFIPRGFAHGFVVLSETATFAYKVDNSYSPEHEDGIMWNDPSLAIDWEIDTQNIKLSDKDKNFSSFMNFETPFK